MPDLLFSIHGAFNSNAQAILTQYNSGEHFGSQPLALDPASDFRMQVERCHGLPCPVSAHTTWTRYAFRRTRAHIRRDRSQFSIVNYIERGSMTITQAGHKTVTHAGGFVIVPVGEPFIVECIPDDECHRGLYILCPNHDIQRHIPSFTPSAPLSVSGDMIASAGRMLNLLFRDGETIDALSFQSILNAMFRQIAVTASGEPVTRLSVQERRLCEIRAYLELHLAQPGLSLAQISADMGLSVRYITKLFQRHDTSFSRTLWSMRLEKVREWMGSPDMAERSIAELAYAAGFKSAPHLSKVFQERFGMPPREYRRRNLHHGTAAVRLN